MAWLAGSEWQAATPDFVPPPPVDPAIWQAGSGWQASLGRYVDVPVLPAVWQAGSAWQASLGRYADVPIVDETVLPALFIATNF